MWIRGEAMLGLVMTLGVLILELMTRRKMGKGNERFPPGPWGWPVIGHLYLLVFSLPHQMLAAVSRKYGPVLGLYMGQQRTVIVSSPQAARQVLLTHDKLFAQRPRFQFTSLLMYGSDNGIAFNQYAARWRRHRKICTLQLFTPKRLHELQHLRQLEVRTLLHSMHRLSRAGTAAIDIGDCLSQMSSRSIMRLVNSNPCVQVGNENLHRLFSEMEHETTPTLGDFIPPLSFLDFFKKQSMRRFHVRLDKVLNQILMERKNSTASFHDDLLHSLLCQEDALTMVEIKGIISDIIGGGVHTTSLTLEWAMAELLRHPHCFHRLQREIDTKIGENRQVTDADLPNLSYLNCVVKEVFRLHPIAPLLGPHFSTEECEVQGYIIPAKTLVFVNVWAIGRSEKVWRNANEFTPERFEGSDLDFKGQHFELLPFGSGRKTCVGLPFASSNIHVTLANLVKFFDWELPDRKSHTSINMDEKRGLIVKKDAPMIAIPKLRVPFPNE